MSCPPLLAIGIDAAQPTLIREMIELDELPILKSLLSKGRWIRVESPGIGGSAVWPSFVTGEDPYSHGIYAEWCWEAATMSLSRFTGRHLTPFWKALADNGHRIGILAVPFMPFLGLANGFEVSEWGPFLLLDNGKQAGNPGDASFVTRDLGIEPSGPRDYPNLKRLTLASIDGVRERGALARRLLTERSPDCSVIVFTETHRSGHSLWHTVDPEHEMYAHADFQNLRDVRPTLKNIYEEVDRQVGELVSAIGESATILVFSLHGMQPARGMPAFLTQLLFENGFAHLANWQVQSWTERSRAVFASLKHKTPRVLKSLYYKSAPPSTILKWARPTMLPLYDWSRTRAFSLPTEQSGYIRINLIGREAAGIVSFERYLETCEELEQWLRSLTSEDGRPLAREVIRTANQAEDAPARLPDLVVDWENAAFASPLRINGSPHEFHPEITRFVSRHAFEGFCILKGGPELEVGNVVAAEDLGRLMSQALSDKS